MSKFAINGFGRIGRTSLRVWWENYQDAADLAVINTSGSMEIEGWAHLLKYDSNYGVWPHEISTTKWQSAKEATDEKPELGLIHIDGRDVLVTAQRDPKKIPWGKYEVDVVIESTGVFRDEKAKWHIESGAKRVVLSAPAKNDSFETIVLGVENIDQVSGELISNASCTTNCVAPVAQIMHSVFGVEKAMLTTIHAYTDDQNIQDNSHKKYMRRARAGAKNIIPTSTGAAKATGLVIPELQGIFDGMAVRVPVATGSLSDLTFVTAKNTSVEEVNQAFIDAAKEDRWQGKLAVTNDPVVSSDIIGRPESSIVDLQLTQVIGGNLVKVVAWYDNEWGYCNRLVELVAGL